MWNNEREGKNAKNRMSAEFPYQVNISEDPITVYTGAGLGYVTVGSVSSKDRPEVTEIKEDKNKKRWGKLKSGAGWIPLNDITVMRDNGRKA